MKQRNTEVGQHVLVVEAQAIGMIGVIRSLGAAGYCVHAGASRADAPGLHSRYASVAVQYPAYHSEEFLPWLRRYVAEQQIAAIVPSEAFLLAIAPVYEQYRALLPDAPDAVTLYRCFAKADVEALFATHPDAGLRQQLPRAAVAYRGESLPSTQQFASWQWPLYVKTDGRHADQAHAASVRAVHGPHELLEALSAALATHNRCQIQETVPGVKATVNLWRHRGEIRAESMCVAMHENPHTGGLTAYRKIWWHEAILADAKRRLQALNWQGVAMVEYKYDAATDRFWFLELNARYWNALNLDLLAGKDFPRWQLDAFFGKALVQDLGPGPLGFRARYTVPADVGYLLSRCRDRNVSAGKKIAALVEFVWLSLHPGVRSDLWFPGDRGLYWRAWREFFRKLGQPA
jgi:hypothetical protein